MKTTTARATAQTLIKSTTEACERTAKNFPVFSTDALAAKADLLRVPSASHAAAVLVMLIEIEEGRYEI